MSLTSTSKFFEISLGNFQKLKSCSNMSFVFWGVSLIHCLNTDVSLLN